jgi:hypothetical protein
MSSFSMPQLLPKGDFYAPAATATPDALNKPSPFDSGLCKRTHDMARVENGECLASANLTLHVAIDSKPRMDFVSLRLSKSWHAITQKPCNKE